MILIQSRYSKSADVTIFNFCKKKYDFSVQRDLGFHFHTKSRLQEMDVLTLTESYDITPVMSLRRLKDKNQSLGLGLVLEVKVSFRSLHHATFPLLQSAELHPENETDVKAN